MNENFHEYYRTETNRRLSEIEKDLKSLVELKGRFLGLSIVCSGLISLIVTVMIPLILHK